MAKIMLGGSASVTLLPTGVKRQIREFQDEGVTFLIGDCRGIDTEFQRMFVGEYSNVEIYYSGNSPRNKLSEWKCVPIATEAKPHTREFYTAKDIAMCNDCTAGLFVWDGKSMGTLRNIGSLRQMGKRVHVYRTDKKEWED